ncbi:MAG: gluconokinase, GntK/IdnK-type, partial [Bacteroidota bacterium]
MDKRATPALLIFIMGVSGSGKTTIGQLLAELLPGTFRDGDDFHSSSNRAKMEAGQALTDKDRASWLEAIREYTQQHFTNSPLIVACSALKAKYRQVLTKNSQRPIRWVYLSGTYDCIRERMLQRTKHFMPAELLQSQFDILEAPAEAWQYDIVQSPSIIVQQIIQQISTMNAAFGLIGLGVMGKSLSRNLANHGFRLALYNRHLPPTEDKVAERFIEQHRELQTAQGFDDLEAFVQALEKPRKVFLMVPAGNQLVHCVSG